MYPVITASTFLIPTRNLNAALTALKRLNTDPEHAHKKTAYGSPEPHFIWMAPDYHEHVTSAREVFELLGFEVEVNTHGLALTWFEDKGGDEALFLDAVAHLVHPGSYIEWQNDDYEQWRLDFDGETMTSRTATITYA